MRVVTVRKEIRLPILKGDKNEFINTCNGSSFHTTLYILPGRVADCIQLAYIH
jgi:hypothetical protein